MKFQLFFLIVLTFTVNLLLAQARTIHVFVALCDNINQGIVPVPEKIGNGQDPKYNLYWGAGYGVKNFFDRKTDDWILIDRYTNPMKNILESLLFKHKSENAYLLADAYDGSAIKTTNIDFLNSASGNFKRDVLYNNEVLKFGGSADLLSYIGHTGLMDFSIDMKFTNQNTKQKDVIILSCYSKEYYKEFMKQCGVNPIVWTKGFMAPEAYTLAGALDGWILKEQNHQIEERAAQAYNQYQKCGINGSRRLFTSGF